MNLLNQRQLAAAAVPAVPPQSIATSQLLALMVVFVLSVLLVGIVYWVVVDKFSRWMHQRRRRATSVYLLQFGLVIANAALFNQIEMGELMAGRGSQADFWLAIGLAVLLPPFALVSVLLPIGTAGEVQRVHRLTRENRDLDLWAQHARRARDEVVRLVGCITGTAKERTARLHESETRDGQNCTTLQSALDGETHLKRLVEAIHLLFEPRASAGPTEQASQRQGESSQLGINESESMVSVSWRVALFEEKQGQLSLFSIWDGSRYNCVFTKPDLWQVLFSTTKPQVGTFAVHCLRTDRPVILPDIEVLSGEQQNQFKYFLDEISPGQRQRIRSIAGIAIRTTPVRVLVVDSDLRGFFSKHAHEPLFTQLQRVVHAHLEFEDKLERVIRGACAGCPKGLPGLGNGA